MIQNEFLRSLEITCPIILAPMGGGAGTPELVGAVCNAGGLGSLGAAYLTPDQIANDVRRIRAFTNKPFNVNLFAGGYHQHAQTDPTAMLTLLAEIHEGLGLPPPVLPEFPSNRFDDQLEVILDASPAIFSFTFGIPDAGAMARIKARGIATFGTATTVREALMLKESGVNAIVAQGAEAGAHRGTFAHSFDEAMVPTLELVRAIRHAVPLPVIASGGLMSGHDVMRSLTCGASAAQLGTAFLTCDESSAADAWKRAILDARTDTTVITRAFSGRPARGLANDFIARLANREGDILPFPLQNALTRPMRNAAARLGKAGFLSLWAGQGVTRARSMPAAELVHKLVDEMNTAEVSL